VNRLILCALLGFSGASQGAMKVLTVPGYVPAPEVAVISEQLPTSIDTYGVEPRGYFVVAGAEGNPALGILFGPLAGITEWPKESLLKTLRR
jgi:hypothetical protein